MVGVIWSRADNAAIRCVWTAWSSSINASSSPSKTSADGLSVTVSATGGTDGPRGPGHRCQGRDARGAEIDQPPGHDADEQAGGGRRGHPAEQRPADQRTIRPRGRRREREHLLLDAGALEAGDDCRALLAEPGRREHLVGLAGRVLAQALERGRQLRVPPGARFAPVQVLTHEPPIVRTGCLVAKIQRDQPVVRGMGSDRVSQLSSEQRAELAYRRETGARAPWIRSTR